MGARYYAPSLGRWISEDAYRGSIDDPLSLNLYVFCINNPLIYVDPSGYDPLSLGVALVAFPDPITTGAGLVLIGASGYLTWRMGTEISYLRDSTAVKHDDPKERLLNSTASILTAEEGLLQYDETDYLKRRKYKEQERKTTHVPNLPAKDPKQNPNRNPEPPVIPPNELDRALQEGGELDALLYGFFEVCRTFVGWIGNLFKR